MIHAKKISLVGATFTQVLLQDKAANDLEKIQEMINQMDEGREGVTLAATVAMCLKYTKKGYENSSRNP